MHAGSLRPQVRRFRLMLQPLQEAAGSALLHHDDDLEVKVFSFFLCSGARPFRKNVPWNCWNFLLLTFLSHLSFMPPFHSQLQSHSDPAAMLSALMQRSSTHSKGSSSTDHSPYQRAQHPNY